MTIRRTQRGGKKGKKGKKDRKKQTDAETLKSYRSEIRRLRTRVKELSTRKKKNKRKTKPTKAKKAKKKKRLSISMGALGIKRKREDQGTEHVGVRRLGVSGPQIAARRRIDAPIPADPTITATAFIPVTASGIEADSHVFMVDDINKAVADSVERDIAEVQAITDAEADETTEELKAIMESGLMVIRDIPDMVPINMGVVSDMGKFVGSSALSIGGVVLRSAVDNLKSRASGAAAAAGSAAAAATPEELSFLGDKVKSGLSLINKGLGYLKAPAQRIVTNPPLPPERLQEMNENWDNFKTHVTVLLNPTISDEDKRERLNLLEDMVKQFNDTLGKAGPSGEERDLREETWEELTNEISQLKAELGGVTPLTSGPIGVGPLLNPLRGLPAGAGDGAAPL